MDKGAGVRGAAGSSEIVLGVRVYESERVCVSTRVREREFRVCASRKLKSATVRLSARLGWGATLARPTAMFDDDDAATLHTGRTEASGTREEEHGRVAAVALFDL